MHVTGQHDVRPVLVDPTTELRIAIVLPTGPAHRRAKRRPVIHPHPSGWPAGRIASKLCDHSLPSDRPIPPWADGDQGVADQKRVPIGRHARGASLVQPQRGSLAVRVVASEVMVAGADDNPTRRLQQRDVVQDHSDLGIERDSRTDVQLIARKNHEVEFRGGVDDPVELAQRVVEIRDKKDAHGYLLLRSWTAECRTDRDGPSKAEISHMAEFTQP